MLPTPFWRIRRSVKLKARQLILSIRLALIVYFVYLCVKTVVVQVDIYFKLTKTVGDYELS